MEADFASQANFPSWRMRGSGGGHFLRRFRLDVERMEAALELFFQRIVYGTLALDAGLTGKLTRDDLNLEMCLAFRARPRMACMACTVIGHAEGLRCKNLRQSSTNPL